MLSNEIFKTENVKTTRRLRKKKETLLQAKNSNDRNSRKKIIFSSLKSAQIRIRTPFLLFESKNFLIHSQQYVFQCSIRAGTRDERRKKGLLTFSKCDYKTLFLVTTRRKRVPCFLCKTRQQKILFVLTWF
ncbi:hypothetical protein CDAR_15471 [Caerostris darwini]|uniref:Uncharacterized protein n=1 Tax=Caerostris darwini TaxID=1538125 RepID=A0AAV4PX44_9ARAC|nr:hypothetical protein CDAR_15471 [Caerostris darwini]